MRRYLLLILALVVIALVLVCVTQTNTPPKVKVALEHPIIVGPSRSECAVLNIAGYGQQYVDEAITNFDDLTGTTLTCLDSYLNGAPTWNNWVHPWIDQPNYGYVGWVNEDPSVHQLVLQLDLIPVSLQNIGDPLAWETACAAGDYNSHAVEFAQQMVKTGLGNSVIRLGAEANGPWETDYIGTTVQEQNLWAKCFDQEVTQFRRVKGAHFLIDWNPNAAAQPITYSTWYPGNKYVNIIGLDQYDVDAFEPNARVLFPSLAHESYGLAHFEAFAKATGKPMSFPEWGLWGVQNGDDAQFFTGIGAAVNTKNFAFESYFDVDDGGTVPLSSSVPLSLAAYTKAFGSSSSVKPVKSIAPSKHLPPKHLPPVHKA
jgi:hypothetical protein